MQKNLVIVESPAKAKTIEKFLGKDYRVMSSFGHIRDLHEKGFGIDVANNFEPNYVIPSDKTKLVSDLRKAANEADVVWLASDEDREGEAIAWHLYEVLGLKEKTTHRIVFHEITKNAILNAIDNPREINLDVVDAQQARRVLDRIVGFELSPVLWRKIKPSLSAGRVQSVTVRLVVEREREIQQFKAEASFRVVATFVVKNEEGKDVEFKAELRNRFATEAEAKAFLETSILAKYDVESIETRPTRRTPAAPFTTSTLQQEASRKFGFPVATTMRVAQSLYESGKITYMRTDSVNLSDLALNTAKAEILEMVGEKYYKRRQYSTKSKGAQEAHEAIRPTYMNVHEIEGTAQERKLYDLIWKRTIASQMADAEFEKTTAIINIDNSDEKFVAIGEVLKFDGFLNVYMESTDDETAQETEDMLPKLSQGDILSMLSMQAQERFTQRPARYTEASLVRKLEELGIGRPSTYAPTISTILARDYVEKREIQNEARPYRILTLKNGKIKEEDKLEKASIEKGKLSPTDIGIVVNDYLLANFPNIMDYNFTASVEQDFDKIAEGKLEWTKNIDVFYTTFHPNVEEAMHSTGKKAGERELGIDPISGRPVFVKIGRFGPVAQIGLATDDEKPRFASLRTGQSMEALTLEEALELFKLPIDFGEYEGEALSIGVGKFGPYVRHGKTYISIPKEEDPLTITRERAIELIAEKRQADKNREIKKFEAEDILVLNGRFGAYITHAGENYKLPKGTVAESLTLEQCQEIIANEANKSKGTAKKKTTRGKKK
ncbi:MAG: type I DNA topoisomerase [Paludibacteraceae bacterium]|jgi:DNA topoisomerase-1|nr:type I DNA topoisomerase [Paludibacteraceae bacterium]